MWTTQDYPDSWKNLNALERKKAIDVGEVMLTLILLFIFG